MTLFAYGTLLVPEIWLSVTGRPYGDGEEAVLPRYVIRRITGAGYPGIVPGGEADEVAGRVFVGLDHRVMRLLDEYEGSLYDRIPVSLRNRRGETVLSQAYVVPERNRGALSDDGWSLEWFRKHAMERFLRRHFSWPFSGRASILGG